MISHIIIVVQNGILPVARVTVEPSAYIASIPKKAASSVAAFSMLITQSMRETIFSLS